MSQNASAVELHALRAENHALTWEASGLRRDLNKHINMEIRRKRLLLPKAVLRESVAQDVEKSKSELTQAEKQLRQWIAAHGDVQDKLRTEGTRRKLLQERLALEEQKGLRLLGEDTDDCSEAELRALRGQLGAAQERVAQMLERRAAEARVAKKFPHYQCPLSLSIMRDPVVTADGQSYERKQIEQWFRTCRDAKEPVTSPLRAPLASDALVPNNSLRRAIDEATDRELGVAFSEIAVQLKLDAAGGAAKRARRN
jgi:hypothetical protein